MKRLILSSLATAVSLFLFSCDNGTGPDETISMSLKGATTDTINIYERYDIVDSGVTVIDPVDGDISATAIADFSHIDATKIGNYTVYYEAVNSLGDTARAERTVVVAVNIVEVTENITTATTWSHPNVYMIKNQDFYVQAPLTIEPGVTVMLSEEGPDLQVSSTTAYISAQGTEARPIIFTSLFDDNAIGDVNGDGTLTTPTKGDWGSIELIDQTSSLFEQVKIHYAGGGTYQGGIICTDGKITVDSCEFSHNRGGEEGDYWYGALTVEKCDPTSTITNSVFYDNGLPLVINSTISLDNSNRFHNPNNNSVTNDKNGIYTHLIDEITTEIAWEETEVAFVIDDIDVRIKDAGSLRLGDNVVIKFTSESAITLDAGAAVLVNHNGTGVAFTSIRDDSRKGDTNGDNNTTSPAEADWGLIYDGTAPVGEINYFTWANIFYDKH